VWVRKDIGFSFSKAFERVFIGFHLTPVVPYKIHTTAYNVFFVYPSVSILEEIFLIFGIGSKLLLTSEDVFTQLL
jgi:hypothetical protein